MSPFSSHNSLSDHLSIALSGIATVFARRRRWSPRAVVMAVLQLTRPHQRATYTSVLSTHFQSLCQWLAGTAVPARSGLCAARKKVPVATFRQVLHQLVDHLGSIIPGTVRHHSAQRRFIAIDGTSLVCPHSPDLLDRLSRPPTGWNPWVVTHYPRALLVVAFDVVRRLPVEWVVLPKGRGERAAIDPLSQRLRSGDVVILDRGYPSRALLQALVSQGIDVVMRMTSAQAGTWTEVREFLASKAKTAVIRCDVDNGTTVDVRLLRRNPPRGRPLKHQQRETMVILTTLLPRHGFEAKDIFDLYGRRWGIESLFREMKEAFTIERFHARTLDGVEQEIATVLMWIALSAGIHAAVQEDLTDGKRAIVALSRDIARECIDRAIAGQVADVDWFIREARRHAYKPRPGRSFPRESKLPFGRFRNRRVK